MHGYKWKTIFLAIGAIILFIELTACSKEDRYIGIYKIEEECSPECEGLYMELKPGGKGIRRVRGEDVPFSWIAKGDEIRIHTDSGGVIVGKLKKGVLEVKLPGLKMVRLEKIK